MLLKRRGQSTLEYAVLIGIVAGGLIVMQIYLKRAKMGGLRQAADDIGTQFNPNAYTMNVITTTNGGRTQTGAPDGSSGVVYTGLTESKSGGDGFQIPGSEDLGLK